MMRKNQKGFTLVELIIAVAILAIVTLAVCGFIVVGSRSYTSANTDIMLQQEAQLALNQISDVIIDTTDSITYSVGTSTSLQNVLKDSEYGGEATDKCLVVVNRNDTSSNNDNPSYWFYWKKDEETIYFNEVPGVNSTMSADEIEAGFEGVDTDMAVLADHVTDLNIDISQFEENRVVMISMTLKNGNREYSTSNNVTVRNRVALNAVNIGPIERVDGFRIETASSVLLEPGEHYTMNATAVTDSSEVAKRAIKWELVDGPRNGTSITPSGELTIGIAETRPNFYARVSRENEDYAGQNDRVSKRVMLYVKRVTDVGGDTITASPGDEITLDAGVRGTGRLGDPCDGCDNSDSGKDGHEDHYVQNWRVSDASLITPVSTGSREAVYKISSTAKDGDEIIVEADSVRSIKKGYGPRENLSTAPVTGRWTIRIEGNSNVIPLPRESGFKFGTDNDEENGMIYDFIYDNAKMTDYNEYLVCARVREMGVNTCDNDQVILYYTADGKNIRFIPDLFGLELNRDYQVFLQLLLPVPISKYEDANGYRSNAGAHAKDSNQTIINEYFANLDSMGAYVGHVYEASAVFSGIISPPFLSIESDGVTYPGDPDYYLACHLVNGNQTVIDAIEFGKLLNITANNSLDQGNIRFSIYTGSGDNLNGWNLIAGYDPSPQVNPNKGSSNFVATSFGGGAFNMSTQSSSKSPIAGRNFLTLNADKNKWQDAQGTYYIVPGYWYANKKNGEFGRSYDIIYEDVNGNHNWYYYLQPESKITLKVDTGLNLPIMFTSNKWTFFPLPTEQAFPFARKSSEVQTTTWSRFDIYSKSGDWDSYIENVKIDCTYKPAVGNDSEVYIIKVYTETRTGLSYSRHIYGEYIWRPGENEWNVNGQIGERDEKGEIETNIEITRDGASYLAYFPAPTDSDYPFKSGTATSVSRNLKIYQKSGSDSQTIKINAESLQNGPTYSIKLTGVELQGKHKQATYDYGIYTYSSSSSTWNLTTPGSATKYEAVGVVTIEYNSGKYNIELPLPNMDGYPITSKQDNVGYAQDDTYCERNIVMWLAFDAVYSQSGSTYTVKVTPMWNSGPSKTFTWQEGQVNWQPSN